MSDKKLKKLYKIIRPYDHNDFSYNPNVCKIITDEITNLKNQNDTVKLLLLTKAVGLYVLAGEANILAMRLLPYVNTLCIEHKVDTSYHKNQVKRLYEFVYPYGKFGGNYADSCIAINQELKTLCRNNNKDILVAIAMGMGLSVSKYDTINSVCEKLQDIINTSCFSIDDNTSARVATNFKLGVHMPRQEGELYDIEEEVVQNSWGFNLPVYVNDNIKEFITNGNFGYINPKDPNSGRLQDVLQVTKNGVSTRAMLTPLFNIYTKVNNMSDPENKSILRSTAEMDNYFQDTYRKLMDRPQRYKRGPDGHYDMTQPIPKFDPKNFRYQGLQLLIGENTVKNVDLNEDQKKFLKNPNVISRLNAESDFVTNMLNLYRQTK